MPPVVRATDSEVGEFGALSIANGAAC